MDAPAKIGDGLVDLDRVAAVLSLREAIVVTFQAAQHSRVLGITSL
jgi:hypothetical protein